MLVPWQRVAVEGDSMAPTLRDGDWVVARRVRDGSHVRAGEIVLARRPDRPSLLLVKRAVRRQTGGWWLLGDDPDRSDDSRLFGIVPDRLVVARVLARYHPAPLLLDAPWQPAG